MKNTAKSSKWIAAVGTNRHGLVVQLFGKPGAKWTPGEADRALLEVAGAVKGYLDEAITYVQVFAQANVKTDRQVVVADLARIGIEVPR